ncbi:MAG: glycosyltransferase family 9 protein [Flavobacteriales bacterium]|nr:glycosyltransferase family 9 protein [Flavobacteriales bacterium]
MKKILIIQTAFIGDVILATPVIEEIKRLFPDAELDVLVRKGNESLLKPDSSLHQVMVWDKKNGKYRQLFRLAKIIRKNKYDMVINLQRFAASGWLTWFSKSPMRIGFDKNPFSFCYHKKIKHEIGNGKHETERNLELIADYGAKKELRPTLHFTSQQEEHVRSYKNGTYVCMAPSSVWFTKQLPEEKWIELIRKIESDTTVYLMGAPGDQEMCERILHQAGHPRSENLCGKLSLTESALLMRDAQMNYVNDSAPLHLASAMNAPVTAFFCSTLPEFGFGPLSDVSIIAQTQENLECRPCGLHGMKTCPKGHFKCGLTIPIKP